MWISDIKKRYKATQIKAAVAINSAQLKFYWDLGRDIAEKFTAEAGYGKRFFDKVSADLRAEFPSVTGFSSRNIRYCLAFFRLYADSSLASPLSSKRARIDTQEKNLQQLVAELVCVPWGHHVTILDKCDGDREKALFYVRRTIQNGWSRNLLLNWISTDLYEREGHAQNNFTLTMPTAESALARQLVKDPHIFEVFGLAEDFSERNLKDAIAANIEKTVLSFGRGVSFLGREYPLEIGGETKFIDMLFYVIPLHRYLVMEIKTTKYEPADIGQLSGYMAMVDSLLNGDGDNSPIGILVCKEHNRALAEIHLAKIGLPMGITDYEIKRLLPSPAQLTRCFSDAEASLAGGVKK